MRYGTGLIVTIAVLVFGLPFILLLLMRKIKSEKKRRQLLYMIFGVYILGNLYYTLLSREVMPAVRVRLVLLAGYKNAFAFDSGILGTLRQLFAEGPAAGLAGIHIESTESLKSVVLNILLYIPMGYLLPVLLPGRARGRWMWRVLLLGFAASLTTETIQLLLHLGWFDVDDLLNNTLGTLMGIWLYRNILSEVCQRGLKQEKL